MSQQKNHKSIVSGVSKSLELGTEQWRIIAPDDLQAAATEHRQRHKSNGKLSSNCKVSSNGRLDSSAGARYKRSFRRGSLHTIPALNLEELFSEIGIRGLLRSVKFHFEFRFIGLAFFSKS